MLYICYLCRPLRGPAAAAYMVKESEVTQSCLTLCDPMGFSRQEYWSGLPFPSPGDLPDPGTERRSPTFHLSHQGSPAHKGKALIKFLLLLKPSHFLHFTTYLLCPRRSRNSFISTSRLQPTLLWTQRQCSSVFVVSLCSELWIHCS